MEFLDKDKDIHHLAGIVPIAGQPLEFKMPWHDSMMPVAANYFALEKSLYECALAGCETIWIVAHYGTHPLIKKRIGDFVIDPNSYNSFRKGGPVRTLPVYYVPISPKDKKKRDCLSWSVLYGAYMAHRVSYKISKWVIPEKFYCSFPYGVPDPYTIKNNRSMISKAKKTIFTHNGKTIKDNIHMSFTFDAKDYFSCRDVVRQRDLGTWKEHRLNAALYDLATVFKGLDHTDADVIDLPWFYDISTWEGYKSFLGSEHAKIFKRPSMFFTKHKKRKFIYGQDTIEEVQQDQFSLEGEDRSTQLLP